MYQADADEGLRGIKRLAVYMLRQAAEDIAKGQSEAEGRSDRLTKSRHYDSSMHWLNLNTDAAVPFDYCCEVLDYEPSKVKEKILSDPRGFADALRRNKVLSDDADDVTGNRVSESSPSRIAFRA